VAVEDLTQNFEEFQAKMTTMTLENKRLAEEFQQISTPVKTKVPKDCADDAGTCITDEEEEIEELSEESFEKLTCVEQAKYVERRLDAVNETLSAASTTAHPTPGKFSTPGSKKGASGSGSGFASASKRAGNSIIGTPTARPFNWIVKQANSEVKALRERAEKLHWNIRPSSLDDVLADNTPSKTLTILHDKENETPRKAQLKANERALKDTLYDYRKQLEEACSVICEQDRLIHAGNALCFDNATHVYTSIFPIIPCCGCFIDVVYSLLLFISALLGRNTAAGQSHEYIEEEEEEGGGSDFEEGSGAGVLTPSSKLALGSSYEVSDWSVENFLPSGRCAHTITVLYIMAVHQMLLHISACCIMPSVHPLEVCQCSHKI
jgi:hypothetical protein